MQRGDLVVERIAALVEAPRRAALEHSQQHFLGQDAGFIRHEVGGDLEQVQRTPGVAVDSASEQPAQRRRHLEPHRAEPAFGIRERPLDNGLDRVLSQRLQDVDPGSRQQCVVELERRVLRRRSDEDDGPVLHVGQERVLLALVEAVHLVDEEHAIFPVLGAAVFRLRNDPADLLHPGEHRREREKKGVGVGGDEPPQGRLPGAGRPPEDHRVGAPRLDRGMQRLAGTEDVVLPDELVESTRPHAIRERPGRIGGRFEESFLAGQGHFTLPCEDGHRCFGSP